MKTYRMCVYILKKTVSHYCAVWKRCERICIYTSRGMNTHRMCVYILKKTAVHYYAEKKMYIYIYIQDVGIHSKKKLLHMIAPGTGWRSYVRCLILIGHFPQKSPIISG